MTAQEIKEQAIEKAQELRIDMMVRTIAKSGTCDGAGINYCAKWEDFGVFATFGAGTNSARVQKIEHTMSGKRLIVYQADEYGQYIKVFRYGPWVERMQETVGKLFAQQEAEEIVKKEAEQETIREAFSEIDI